MKFKKIKNNWVWKLKRSYINVENKTWKFPKTSEAIKMRRYTFKCFKRDSIWWKKYILEWKKMQKTVKPMQLSDKCNKYDFFKWNFQIKQFHDTLSNPFQSLSLSV